MSVGLEKTEQQLEKAYNELSVIRDRKADIIEKEKAVMAHIEKLENQRILQIVGIFNLNGDDLKKKLAAYAKKHPDRCSLKETTKEGSATYVVDKARLTLRLTEPYSEERRKAASAKAKAQGLGMKTAI